MRQLMLSTIFPFLLFISGQFPLLWLWSDFIPKTHQKLKKIFYVHEPGPVIEKELKKILNEPVI